MQVALRIEDRELRAALRSLTDEQGRAAIAEGINKVSFEVLEELKREVRISFAHVDGKVINWLASFFFDKARADNLRSVIYPTPHRGDNRRERILHRQATGGIFGPQDEVLRLGDMVAVPVAVPTSSRAGRIFVRQPYLPSRVIRRPTGTPPKRARSSRPKGFVAGRAILERVQGRVRVLYALVPKIRVSPRFDFEGAVRRRADRVVVEKFRRAFEKAVARRRV